MEQRHAGFEPRALSLVEFARRAAAALREDERVRAVWLTGSLATGTADAQSDVDLRVAVRAEDFPRIDAVWPELVGRAGPAVWKRRWPGPPDEAIVSAITRDYLRFDLVIQSDADSKPRTLEAAQVLVDKDGVAGRITLTAPARHDPLARLAFVVEEFIRLVGMLTIVVGRDDVPMGMEGQLACHSLLISLLLMENGIDRVATGKRHVASLLTDEQRAVLASVPALAPTMQSVIDGRVAYASLFLPRARRLMATNGLAYPEEFEKATREHLRSVLGVQVKPNESMLR